MLLFSCATAKEKVMKDGRVRHVYTYRQMVHFRDSVNASSPK